MSRVYQCIGLETKFTKATENMENIVHFTTHFPSLLKIGNMLPDAVVEFCTPVTKPVLQYQRVSDCEDEGNASN